MAFVEAGELFRYPARLGAWNIEDTTFLQAQGRGSRWSITGRWYGSGSNRARGSGFLPQFVRRRNRHLGALACPARQNVDASPNANRISIRRQDASGLKEKER